MSDWYPQPEREPRGLFGFLGSPETGESVGDSLGLVSQILMNLGSGRGGAGLTEAMNNFDERRIQRRDRRQMMRMANRMADKLEETNPDLAAMIRANPKYGLELAGKLALQPIEFAQEEKLAKMRGDIDYDKAVALADRKAELERERSRLWIEQMGGGKRTQASPTTPEQTSSLDIPTEALVPNDPNMTSLGTGEGEVQITPLSATSVVTPPNQPAPESQIPPEYMVGLPNDPAQAESLLNLRLNWKDPDMPLEDMFLFYKSGGTENHVGFDDFRKAVNERKERRARVEAFKTGANETARQNQVLPGINLQKPGEPELMQFGIDPRDPTIIPPNQVQQAAGYLQQSAKSSDKDLTTAIKDIMNPPNSGWSVDIDPVTGKVTGISQGKGKSSKATADENKAGVYFDQAAAAAVELSRPESIAALSTPSLDTFTAMLSPDGMKAILLSDEYSAAEKSALGFTEAVVRYKSGAQITPSELAMNYQIFIPQAGEMNKPKTLAFKKRMREKILKSIGSKRDIDTITEDGWDDLNDAIANGNIEPGERYVPPMAQWAIDAEITPEQWAAGSADLWFPTDQKKTEEE